MAKILITIPDEKYNNLMYGESVDEQDAFEAVDCICNGTVISSNATNGDMIKNMFPNCVIDEDFGGAVITNIDTQQYWKKDWWDAPYKETNLLTDKGE